MDFFHILAHGHSFDVSKFLSSSSLIPSLKWNVGQRSPAMQRAKTHGFIIYLAPEETLNYQTQQELSLEFIRQNQLELNRCSTYPGVDYFSLSLHFVLPLSDSMFGFATNMNQDLLAACVKVGLKPSVFVEFDRQTEHMDVLDAPPDKTE